MSEPARDLPVSSPAVEQAVELARRGVITHLTVRGERVAAIVPESLIDVRPRVRRSLRQLTLGNRVCVMREGRIQQVDTPQRLFGSPVNLFVAGFIGSPAMNFVTASLVRDDGRRSPSPATSCRCPRRGQ